MKNIILLIILTILVNSLTSCKKDIDEEQEKSFRLKEIIAHEGDEERIKFEFFYKNNILSKIKAYKRKVNENWNFSAVSAIAYQADVITIEMTSGGYQGNFIYTFSDNLLTNQRFTSNATYENYYNISYEYNNQLVLRKKITDVDSEYIKEETFFYNNERLSEIHKKILDTNSFKKRIFEYTNSKMSAYYDTHVLNGEWYIPHMFEFKYKNEYLDTKNNIYWYNSEMENTTTTEFIYDTTGSLSSVLREFTSLTFISEEGESNLDVFIRPDNAMYPYPEYYSSIFFLDSWFIN